MIISTVFTFWDVFLQQIVLSAVISKRRGHRHFTLTKYKTHYLPQHDWWVGGITTSLIALVPLLIIAVFLYCGWSRLKQVTSQ